MQVRVLCFVIALAGSLGLLHLLLARKSGLPVVPFCAAASAASLVAGLASVGDVLMAQVRADAATAAWFPVLGLGFAVTGAVAGAGWLGLVRALEAAARRALARRKAG